MVQIFARYGAWYDPSLNPEGGEMPQYQIVVYQTAAGSRPFESWLSGLDEVTAARIDARLTRFEQGHFGDFKSVAGPVMEARLDFGSGYRIYFARAGKKIIILLYGGHKGSKSNQNSDIQTAAAYFKDHTERCGQDG
jgi:putative addiction module killer protein